MKKLNIEAWNEWKAILSPNRYNWVSLTLLNVYFEWYKQWGQLEFQMVLLGFGFYLTYDLGETKFRKDVLKRAKSITFDKSNTKKQGNTK